MTRPIRIQYPGAVYHVMARGNEKKLIFFTDQDRLAFQSVLVEMLERFDVVLNAFCLMPNHYHLLVQTLRGNLSQAMGWLQTTFTIRYNLYHQRTGHLFQGRYKAHLVEADYYARKLVEYVHLNPVRPRDKRSPIPSSQIHFLNRYSWSSHPNYFGVYQNPPWLSLDWLKYWDKQDKVIAQKKYRKAIFAYFEKPAVPIWDELKGSVTFGREAFYDKIKERILAKNGNEEMRFSKKEMTRKKQEKVREIALGETNLKIKMWLRVRFGGERMVDLAREFGYRDGTGVLHAVKSLERKAEKDEAIRGQLLKAESHIKF